MSLYLLICVILSFASGFVASLLVISIKHRGVKIVTVKEKKLREAAWKLYKASYDDAMLSREAQLGFDTQVREGYFNIAFSEFEKTLNDPDEEEL